MTTLVCVPPTQIVELWPIVKPMLRRSYEAFDEFLPPDLAEWLAAGKGLLWVCIKETTVLAAMTTSLERKPSGLCCRMVAAGGEKLEEWKDFETRIVEYARAEGCVKVYLEGRNGWARALPGYTATRVHMEKVL